VVFVHGCFWHMHNCKYGKPAPATNKDFWAQKRRGNADRDKRHRAALRADGWKVFEIWECETKLETKLLAKLEAVVEFVRAARAED
jgi:DNA mismatch endonuclease (patch repair protein)